jgi:hypothetical protein
MVAQRLVVVPEVLVWYGTHFIRKGYNDSCDTWRCSLTQPNGPTTTMSSSSFCHGHMATSSVFCVLSSSEWKLCLCRTGGIDTGGVALLEGIIFEVLRSSMLSVNRENKFCLSSSPSVITLIIEQMNKWNGITFHYSNRPHSDSTLLSYCLVYVMVLYRGLILWCILFRGCLRATPRD